MYVLIIFVWPCSFSSASVAPDGHEDLPVSIPPILHAESSPNINAQDMPPPHLSPDDSHLLLGPYPPPKHLLQPLPTQLQQAIAGSGSTSHAILRPVPKDYLDSACGSNGAVKAGLCLTGNLPASSISMSSAAVSGAGNGHDDSSC